MNSGGDRLARGFRSVTFGPAKVSQEAWDAIFGEEKPKQKKIETKPLKIPKDK